MVAVSLPLTAAVVDAQRSNHGQRGLAPATAIPSAVPLIVVAPQTPSTPPPSPVVTPPQPTPTPTPPPAARPAAATVPATRLVAWGAFVDGFPGSTSALDSVERSAGRHLDIVMWYMHWGGSWSALDAADVRAVIARGSLPMITWMSDDPTASSQAAYTAMQVTSGRYDAYIRSWATGLRDIGRPVLLRFDHEMNGDWMAWSAGKNGQTPQDFVAMWRRVHDIFAAAGATNVQWVWSPNIVYSPSSRLAPFYPGDAYVDRVGVDGYNWGPSFPYHSWQKFAGIFDDTLGQVRAITRKPLMLAEIGSTEVGGDKGAWIRDFFASLVQRPDITAFVWFDVNKETDWRLNSSAGAQAAFVAGLRSVS